MSVHTALAPEAFHQYVHTCELPLEVPHEELRRLCVQFGELDLEKVFFYLELARTYQLESFLPMVVPQVYVRAFADVRDIQAVTGLIKLYLLKRSNIRLLDELLDDARALRANVA